MTPPAPSGGTSPLRIGGLALIGVGAVAALIGVASLIGGGSGSADAAAPATTSAAAPAPETSAAVVPAPAPTSATAAAPTTTADGAVPVPSFRPTPTAAAPRTAAPTPTAPKVAKSALRVYNNSTITGLAARAASAFRASGWPVDAVANYPQGIIPTTTVYYRPGTAEQASAESLASAFGMRAEPRFQGLDEATPGLIVIVTNDFKGN